MSDFIEMDPEIIGKFINEFLNSVMNSEVATFAPFLDIPQIEKCLVELIRSYTPLSQLQRSYVRIP